MLPASKFWVERAQHGSRWGRVLRLRERAGFLTDLDFSAQKSCLLLDQQAFQIPPPHQLVSQLQCRYQAVLANQIREEEEYRYPMRRIP